MSKIDNNDITEEGLRAVAVSDTQPQVGTCDRSVEGHHKGLHRQVLQLGQSGPPFPCTGWTLVPQPTPAEPRIETPSESQRHEDEMVANPEAYLGAVAEVIAGAQPEPELRSLAWKIVSKICMEPSREFEGLVDEVAALMTLELGRARTGSSLSPSPAMEMFSSDDHAKWYRQGYIEGSQAGLKIAQDVMAHRLPDPIIIQRASPPSSPGAPWPEGLGTCDNMPELHRKYVGEYSTHDCTNFKPAKRTCTCSSHPLAPFYHQPDCPAPTLSSPGAPQEQK